ncbi:MAG: hypothetical protein HY319_10345, partial [Armatimonadetes bacterium]|nr:hypothetical protein [Armatimonadota bacterium]
LEYTPDCGERYSQARGRARHLPPHQAPTVPPLNPVLTETITRMLALQPQDRFSSLQPVLERLEPLAR